MTRYVALGDSYTIGTAVDPADRFPEQLVRALADTPTPLDLVANLGVNGYTTADLIRDELPVLAGLRPAFVTLLIGVNDVVAGVTATAYEANVITILDAVEATVPVQRIVTVAIPDYTATPRGGDFGERRQQHDAIVLNNATMARLAASAYRRGRHLRSLAARRRRPLARRRRRAPPLGSPVHALGRAHRARRRAPTRSRPARRLTARRHLAGHRVSSRSRG